MQHEECNYDLGLHWSPLVSIVFHWSPLVAIGLHISPLVSIALAGSPLVSIGLHLSLLVYFGLHWGVENLSHDEDKIVVLYHKKQACHGIYDNLDLTLTLITQTKLTNFR